MNDSSRNVCPFHRTRRRVARAGRGLEQSMGSTLLAVNC
jgi:hypothetical protein